MGERGLQNNGNCLFYQLHLWYVSLVAWPSVPGEGWSRPSDRINRGRNWNWGKWGGGVLGVLMRNYWLQSSNHEKNMDELYQQYDKKIGGSKGIWGRGMKEWNRDPGEKKVIQETKGKKEKGVGDKTMRLTGFFGILRFKMLFSF